VVGWEVVMVAVMVVAVMVVVVIWGFILGPFRAHFGLI